MKTKAGEYIEILLWGDFDILYTHSIWHNSNWNDDNEELSKLISPYFKCVLSPNTSGLYNIKVVVHEDEERETYVSQDDVSKVIKILKDHGYHNIKTTKMNIV